MTPPEVWADRRPGTEPDRPGWRVRVVPNKFPAFAGPLTAATSNGGLYRSAPTAGVHEVVIHNPDHQATLADLAVPEVARAMAAWRRRLAAHRDRALGAVLVIVNQGRTAGASLEHPHSQVFATAGRPDRIQAELDRLAGAACAACATVAAERDGPRLVGATGELLTICPWASAFPFETLLLRPPTGPGSRRAAPTTTPPWPPPSATCSAASAGWPATRPPTTWCCTRPAGGRRLPLAPAPAAPPDHLRRVRAGHRRGHQRRRPRPGGRHAPAAASGS